MVAEGGQAATEAGLQSITAGTSFKMVGSTGGAVAATRTCNSNSQASECAWKDNTLQYATAMASFKVTDDLS